MQVTQSDSTVAAMRQKVRRLVAASGESSLLTTDIDKALNTFINQDFPYAIKIDQLRSIYTFFTRPYIDRYPIDVNYNQGFRSPVYFEGIKGTFYKDREQFYNLWPRFPTLLQEGSADGIHFSFTLPGPFLSREVVMGGVDSNGNAISLNDDGNGNMLYLSPNPQISVPAQNTNPAISGFYNKNTASPGLNNPTIIGTVDYVLGDIAFTLPPGVVLAAGTLLNIFISQYTHGRPYCLLFFNNEFTVRPIPKLCHKIEVEVFLTPIEFMLTTDVPILTQWWQYISYGAAIELLRERQDVEGIQNLMEGFKRQEALVLERQSIEEIGVPNYQLFNSTQTQYVNGGWGQGFWG